MQYHHQDHHHLMMIDDYLHENVVQLFVQLYVLVIYFDDEDHFRNYLHHLHQHQDHHRIDEMLLVLKDIVVME